MSQEDPIVIDDEDDTSSSSMGSGLGSGPALGLYRNSTRLDARERESRQESPSNSPSSSQGAQPASALTRKEKADDDDDHILNFQWRKGPKTSSSARYASDVSSAREPSQSSLGYYASASQTSSIAGSQDLGAEADVVQPKRKRSKKDSSEVTLPKPPKPKKNAKSAQEKLEIAAALGKYRHLEVRAIASDAFFSSTAGATFEYAMIENDRANNVIKTRIPFKNAIYFQRHNIEIGETGDVTVSDKFYLERISIVQWSGFELIDDMKTHGGRSKRINELQSLQQYLNQVRSSALPCEHSVRILLTIENCDRAIAQTRFNAKLLEEFLVINVEVALGINYVHMSTGQEIGTLIYENYEALERWPYRKATRAFDYLDNVRRLKSFSASQESVGERVTNRAIDGIQLKSIWTNMLNSFPRCGQTVAEGMTESFPSIKSLVRTLQDDPHEAEEALSRARGVRREHKLARAICTLFTSDDPDERLV